MASLRKLSPAEVVEVQQRPLGARAQIAREYDAYVAGFVVGDQGRVELAAGEQRTQVRIRLKAAARRRGLALRFRPGRGEALFFRVEDAPPMVAARPAPTPAVLATDQQSSAEARVAQMSAVPALVRLTPTPATPAADQQESGGARREPVPAAPAADQKGSAEARRGTAPPQPRRRPTATERYNDVLPRWMREGQQPGRRDGRKRRVR